HGSRQALATKLFGGRQALPATHHILLVGFFVALGGDYFAIFQLAAFFVAALVQGAQHFFTEAATLGKDCIYNVRSGVFAGGQALVMGRVVEYIIQQEFHVPQGRFIHRHSRSSFNLSPIRRSEEHTSELQSRENLVCRLLLEKKKKNIYNNKNDI